MINYNCPHCDKVMRYQETNVGYYCDSCGIIYFGFWSPKSDSTNNTLYVNDFKFAEGTFEYCRRLYKLRIFS